MFYFFYFFDIKLMYVWFVVFWIIKVLVILEFVFWDKIDVKLDMLEL